MHDRGKIILGRLKLRLTESIESNYEQKTTLPMRNENLGSVRERGGTLYSTVKLCVCSIILANTVNGQTIMVDGNPSDWPAVLSSSSVSFKSNVVDPINSRTDNVWTRGSQSTDPVSGWHWTLSNTNDKTDLNNSAVALVGHNLYFCADLYANNGNAAIGFWLLKGGVSPVAGGNFSGVHVDGDILVSVLFTHGHRTGTPTIYRWTGGALRSLPISASAAAAATNSTTVTSPWPYTPKHGSSGSYPTNSFFEGFVNLDSLGSIFNGCFGSYIFQTWESHSPRAALADLIAGTFPAGPSVMLANDTVCEGSSATFMAYATGGSSLSYSWNGGTFGSMSSYTTNSSGAVTVAVRTSNGCVAADTAMLVIKPIPVVDPMCDVSQCSGTSASASGFNFTSPTPGTTFTWASTSNVGFGTSGMGNIPAYTVTGSSSTITATVTVTPSNGDCAGRPIRFTICVNPAPVMTALDVDVCVGGSVGLVGTPAGGTWSGYGTSGSTFYAAGISPGTYAVSYWMIGGGGCIGSATAKVTVRDCECGGKPGRPVNSAAIYKVYPNPSYGAFQLNIPPLQDDAEAVVADIAGRIIDRRIISKDDNSRQILYDLGRQSTGTYYIRIENKDVLYSNKITVK
ncbi:MAG: hypothetical protein K0Q79_3681 [Flavipsychrobacter sp.]|jgi:hypothetical protein|nr:hypothetical protein [Flavipsychrobacter sp.]